MSKGTVKFRYKVYYKIGSFIDHNASLQKMKLQATLAQHNVALLDAQQPRENALKGGADYLALIRKSRRLESR